jgi:hypothetical protein
LVKELTIGSNVVSQGELIISGEKSKEKQHYLRES